MEKQDLENVLARMKPIKPELYQAITDLDGELQSVNNVVNVISTIRKVSNILARVVMIL